MSYASSATALAFSVFIAVRKTLTTITALALLITLFATCTLPMASFKLSGLSGFWNHLFHHPPYGLATPSSPSSRHRTHPTTPAPRPASPPAPRLRTETPAVCRQSRQGARRACPAGLGWRVRLDLGWESWRWSRGSYSG
ncbi:hypothetical protein B0H67DRAFT_134120 [Lasiosphaeris hirsuta]|uniref:Uncharacterized protein n=1 Tax=Lasiosphaeris hirsuta TaxID=260670 RepID=A0AA40B0N8_9PEZI|nr:hypothetical protein B0H67DRAFT_134120 [Lasiosphaeris hirsuta]